MKVKLWKVKCSVLYDVKEDVVCAATLYDAMKVAVTNNPNFTYNNLREIEYIKDVDLSTVVTEAKTEKAVAKRAPRKKT